MDKEIKVWLYDILNSIIEIEGYFDEDGYIFEQYLSDIRTKRAVERNLEIIGEVMNRILKKEEHFPIKDAKKIISLRNRIIHSYDMVSDELLWSIITTDLPVLEEEVRQFLNE